jgi:hypothetical protein
MINASSKTQYNVLLIHDIAEFSAADEADGILLRVVIVLVLVGEVKKIVRREAALFQ